MPKTSKFAAAFAPTGRGVRDEGAGLVYGRNQHFSGPPRPNGERGQG
jgi:hypothetical protein